MKDWKTPEIKDLAISNTEWNGGNDCSSVSTPCPTPVFSGGICDGDVNFNDGGNEKGDNNKHHHGRHH